MIGRGVGLGLDRFVGVFYTITITFSFVIVSYVAGSAVRSHDCPAGAVGVAASRKSVPYVP